MAGPTDSLDTPPAPTHCTQVRTANISEVPVWYGDLGCPSSCLVNSNDIRIYVANGGSLSEVFETYCSVFRCMGQGPSDSRALSPQIKRLEGTVKHLCPSGASVEEYLELYRYAPYMLSRGGA
jgi:hypothetical protein